MKEGHRENRRIYYVSDGRKRRRRRRFIHADMLYCEGGTLLRQGGVMRRARVPAGSEAAGREAHGRHPVPGSVTPGLRRQTAEKYSVLLAFRRMRRKSTEFLDVSHQTARQG